MVQLIVGKKGKGKTKQLLDKVNGAIKAAEGNIVYLDKSSKHMYELNNKIRLIDVSGYPIKNADEFIGFVCGIVSQDHDLQEMYLDSFLKNAKLEGKDITDALHQLKDISEAYKINFVLSVSMDATLATVAITMRNSRNVFLIVIRSLRVSVGETTEKGAKVQTA